MNLTSFLSDLLGKRVEVLNGINDGHDYQRGVLRGLGASPAGVVLVVEIVPGRYVYNRSGSDIARDPLPGGGRYHGRGCVSSKIFDVAVLSLT